MTIPANPLTWAGDAFKKRHYDKQYQYVSGVQELAYATEKFRSAFGLIFREFAYNRCAMVVDAHADRLQVVGFGAKNEALAKAAQQLWDDNHMDVREGQIESEAFTTGDGYLLIEVHPETGAIQFWPQAASNIRVHYSDTEPGRIDLAVKRWIDEEKYLCLNLYYPDKIEKYRSPTPTLGETFSDKYESLAPYQPDGDTQWPVMLPVTDTVPIFHFANNAAINSYGVSELRDVIPIQDAINKTVMDMLVTMEFAAYPQRVLINVDLEDDDTEAAVRRFQTGVDRLLTLLSSGDKQPSIAEFTAANITQYLDVAEKFDQFISRVSKVPVHYLSMSGGFPSGRALRIAEAPFIAKIEDRQRHFGSIFADAMRYALRLKGTESKPGELKVNWQSAAPLSKEDNLDIALQQLAAGIPEEQVWKELGYEPDDITDMQEMQTKAADLARRAFDRGDVLPDDEEEEVA